MSPPLPNKRQSDLAQARKVRYTVPSSDGTMAVMEMPFKIVSDALAFLDAARRTNAVVSFEWLVMGPRGDWVYDRAADAEYRSLVVADTQSLAASSGGGRTARLAPASSSSGIVPEGGNPPGKPMPTA